MEKNSTPAAATLFSGEAWFDPIEAELRERVRGILERAIVAAAGHPDVVTLAAGRAVSRAARSRPSTGDRPSTGREDQLAPLGRKERPLGGPFGETPGCLSLSDFESNSTGGQRRIVRRVGLETETRRGIVGANRRSTAYFSAAVTRMSCSATWAANSITGRAALEPGHADFTIDRAHAVLTSSLRLLECEDRATGQQQRFGDVTVWSPGNAARPCPRALVNSEPMLLFEHGEHRVREPGLKFGRPGPPRIASGQRGFEVSDVLRRHNGALRRPAGQGARDGCAARGSGLIPRPRTKSSRSSNSIMFDGAGNSGYSRSQAKRDRRTSGSFASNPSRASRYRHRAGRMPRSGTPSGAREPVPRARSAPGLPRLG